MSIRLCESVLLLDKQQNLWEVQYTGEGVLKKYAYNHTTKEKLQVTDKFLKECEPAVLDKDSLLLALINNNPPKQLDNYNIIQYINLTTLLTYYMEEQTCQMFTVLAMAIGGSLVNLPRLHTICAKSLSEKIMYLLDLLERSKCVAPIPSRIDWDLYKRMTMHGIYFNFKLKSV